jgi:uncharacterized damage-inducible protein DinB
MSDVERLKDLFRHMEWADAVVWTAALSTSAAAGDENLRGRLLHVHGTQLSFLYHWQGRLDELADPEVSDSASVARWGRRFYGPAWDYLASLDESDLSSASHLRWAAMIERRTGRKPGETTLGETLYQVAMHSTYHRGQAATRLRELGVDPPLTDYIAWVWLGRPGPEWPEATS